MYSPKHWFQKCERLLTCVNVVLRASQGLCHWFTMLALQIGPLTQQKKGTDSEGEATYPQMEWGFGTRYRAYVPFSRQLDIYLPHLSLRTKGLWTGVRGYCLLLLTNTMQKFKPGSGCAFSLLLSTLRPLGLSLSIETTFTSILIESSVCPSWTQYS